MMRILLLVFIFIAIAEQCFAGPRKEADYQREWCDDWQGRTEVVMPNGTRCDCLTETHAVEFDFAKKWLEGIGQSLNYAEQTELRAGIVLICREPKDKRKLNYLRNLIRFYKLPIDVWSMGCAHPQRKGARKIDF